jgi:hypothetical protein
MWRIGVFYSTVLILASVITAAQGEDCLAPAEWFPRTPETDYSVKPDPKSDCDFYKIAWQTFLFVTQPNQADGTTPRFLSFVTPSELFNVNHLMAFPSKRGERLILTPRLAKPRYSRSLGSVNQAVENGVLVDQNGRAVYYGIHLNVTFADFIKTQGFADLTKYKNADPKLEFPRGSVELKSSWRIVPAQEASRVTERYFTVKHAVLAKLRVDDTGSVVVDPNDTLDETVALVGLHVVLTVEGHPEFIWSTFEHVDNAPDLPRGMRPSDNRSVAEDDWTFCKTGTAAKDCNINPRKDSLNPLQLVNPTAQLLTPTVPVFREFAFGGDDPRKIISLTTSVHEKVPAGLAVWKNYELLGAVWLDDPGTSFKENKVTFPDDELGGAKMLSSATMETFTQHLPNGAPYNCFTCHTTGPVVVGNQILNGKRLNISHALNNSFIQTAAGQNGGQGK